MVEFGTGRRAHVPVREPTYRSSHGATGGWLDWTEIRISSRSRGQMRRYVHLKVNVKPSYITLFDREKLWQTLAKAQRRVCDRNSVVCS